MLGLLRKILPSKTEVATYVPPVAASEIALAGTPVLALQSFLVMHESLPMLDVRAVQQWMVEHVPPALQLNVWKEVERNWLLHLRDALGTDFRLEESGNALLLSSLNNSTAQTTVNFMGRTVQRIESALAGIAKAPQWGRDILIVFEDVDSYYRYISYFYPTAGEFAFSGGMYINVGMGHFVTVKSNLYGIEGVIVHEMTHSCLSHLPLPLWLNEGIAVNTERKLVSPRGCACSPKQMHQKHLAFWGETEIQEFWSGASFQRVDEGNELSYDLARIMVELMAKDWPAFVKFANSAHLSDAGYAAALEHMQCDLGEFVCALLEHAPSEAWQPAVVNAVRESVERPKKVCS